jgi:hypothetical protein
MKSLFCALIAAAFPLLAVAQPPIPPEFVGEWVSDDSAFNGEVLAEGGAIYLDADGFIAVFGAPPPVGLAGKASFDPEARQFNVVLNDSGDPPELLTIVMVFDPETKKLNTESSEGMKGSFKHRGKKIPKWVREATR